MKKQTDALYESYAKKLANLMNQNDESNTKLQQDFIRDLIENCIGLLQDLEMLSPDEEEMFEKIKEEKLPTQDMVVDLTYKVLQPRLEYIRMEQEELKEDKMEEQE